jgi:putative addiction module component (TIGR02574 family)
MSMTVDQVEEEAMKLSAEERARLIVRLEATLDVDDEIEETWIEEAERRLEEMHSGQEPGIPIEQLASRMQAYLK